MFKQDNVAEHFQTAVEDVLQRISLDVGYRPQVYEVNSGVRGSQWS